jgi:predicted nucleotidyltransferase component of viral defense system
MNELLMTGIDSNMTAEQKKNILRENVQIMILKILSDRGVFSDISFVGGTALRIIHSLNRYSEDLDFSLINQKNFDFKNIDKILKTDLEKNNVEYSARIGGKGPVKFIFLKFPDILELTGANRMKSSNLNVKIEIDMNPPSGWETELAIINRFYFFQVNVYKLESLFAGKLHACLYRKYTKARDYYDLMWYLTKKIHPNYRLLSNAATQTEKKSVWITPENLPTRLLDRLKNVDFRQVRTDVAKFLKYPEEASLLSFETFKKLLEKGI